MCGAFAVNLKTNRKSLKNFQTMISLGLVFFSPEGQKTIVFAHFTLSNGKGVGFIETEKYTNGPKYRANADIDNDLFEAHKIVMSILDSCEATEKNVRQKGRIVVDSSESEDFSIE